MEHLEHILSLLKDPNVCGPLAVFFFCALCLGEMMWEGIVAAIKAWRGTK